MMCLTKHRQNSKGFTLVETLIYISVFMIVSVGSIVLIFTLQDMVYEHRAKQVLTRNVTGTFERMMYDIRSADSVNTGASTLGSTPGTLVLVHGPTTTTYALTGNALTVSVNSGPANPLTSDRVVVTRLQFDRYDNSLTEAVRASTTMQASWGNVTMSRSFSNTGVLLGSYD